jgi:hypothetical protein
MTEETNIINETKLINQILEPRLRPQLLFIRVMLSLLYINGSVWSSMSTRGLLF